MHTGKWLPTGFNLFLALLLIVSCEKQNDLPAPASTTPQTKTTDGLVPMPSPVFVVWFRRDNIPSALTNFQGRFGGWSFVIGSKGYIGGGTAVTTNSKLSTAKNVFSFDTATKAWSQNATPPSVVTGGEGAFAIGNNGYVLTGSEDVTQYTYAYSALNNSWSPKAPLPGIPRYYAVGVAIDGKGYIGGGAYQPGLGLNFNNWTQYDPVADRWTEKARLPNEPTYGGVAFVSSGGTGGKAYLCGGYDNEGRLSKALWQYDPATDQWTQKTNFPGSGRAWAVGMNTTNAGFITTGWDGSKTLADVWRYNFATDTWGTEPNIPYTAPIQGLNGARQHAFGFGIGNIIYICGGLSGIDNTSARADLWSLGIPN
ncbi:Kelch repeat-containing protein [Puia sp.]|uniref:Kelch repeat-containing protein n=1 Tax=Puia sp. TaxID=2045100 RepID=UPI002F42C72A